MRATCVVVMFLMAAVAAPLAQPAGVAPGAGAAQAQLAAVNVVSAALIERMLEREVARVAGKGAQALPREALVRAVVQRLAAERSRASEFRVPGAAVAAVNRAVHQVVEETLRSRVGAAAQSIVAHASSISTDERNALMDLYTSTGGASWGTSLNWNGAAGTECTWAGVICDSGQTTVQVLNLRNNNLVGTLPASLSSLKNLLYLDLSQNQLSGSIPTQLGTLMNLQDLYLQYNQLTGSIPTQLGSLADLESLDLSFNQLSGSIPAEFGNLTKLQDLELDANQLSGSIPTQLGNLGNLSYLSIEHNQLSGSIPDLSGLANLSFLGLISNQLSGSISTQLGNLTKLTYLDLSSNQLSGSIPDLSSLTRLNSLDLSSNQLSGSIPTWLGNLTALGTLDLSYNQLSGSIPTQLGNLTALDFLNLSSNQLMGAVPGSITSLTNIVAGLSDFRWNGLYSADSTVVTFVNTAQYGGDWQSTQTVAPTGVTAGAITSTSVVLSWTPITYTGDTGGYQAYYSTTSGGPYTADGITGDKSASSIVVSGLYPGALYYFVVRTVTNPNVNNQNTVTSDPSSEVYATTSCTWPAITSQPQGATIWSGMTATLSVTAIGTAPLSYQWYQGTSSDTSHPFGANASILTTGPLTATTSFWARVSNPCGHADSATATATVGSAPAFAVWVPVASHTTGLDQSQWRSDLGLLNPGTAPANVQGVFYASDGVVADTTYLLPGTQMIVTDVIGQLGASGSGAIEILSDQPLEVTARSYNQVPSTASCYPGG
ncbi:MAG: leucine-rich repeat domain-containing protein, partial [Thermoanaerobaculaceae bacterium]